MRVWIRLVTVLCFVITILDAPGQRVSAAVQPGPGNPARVGFQAAAPLLTALSPSSVAVGSPAFILTVNGSGFTPGASLRWNGSGRPTTFLNSTQLSAAIPAGDAASGGPAAVTVFDPASGETSAPLSLAFYTRSGQDTAPDLVLGQPNFQSNQLNNPLLPGGANRLSGPGGLAVDRNTGRLFVADWDNNRILSWPNAPAFANGQAADLVLGQLDFTSTAANAGGISPHSLFHPEGLALDGSGNLYVADWGNGRVLEYDTPLTSGAGAARVFGQPDFTSGYPNNSGLGTSRLYGPTGLALDAAGNLYVSDTGNHRVLEYDTPLTADASADRVFGQPDFTSGSANHNGVSASSLNHPGGLALDAKGNLYAADTYNNRVLEYDAPLANAAAERVFGQPDFSSKTANTNGLSASSLNNPWGVALDAAGNLYVADVNNNRVLEYPSPLGLGRTAERVFGQPGFTSGAANNGGLGAGLSGPYYVALDARGNLYLADYDNGRVLEYDAPPKNFFMPMIFR